MKPTRPERGISRLRIGPAVIACVLGAVLAGGGAAAPTWRPPARISPADGGPSIGSAEVATNAAGRSVVAWERAGVVQAIARSGQSEPWSAPVDLSAGRDPLVELDASGGAVVAYTKGGFPNMIAQAVSRRSRSSGWEDPVTISSSGNVELTDLAVNAKGDVVAGLMSSSGAGYVAEAAYRDAASATWQPGIGLSDPHGNSPRGTSVAIDETGNAVAVWVRAGPTAGNPVVVASVRRASTGAWEAPVDLAGPFVEVNFEVAMNPSGNAVAAWIATRTDGTVVTESVQASFRPAGGTWTAPVALSMPTRLVRDLQVRMDRAGNALAAWIQVAIGDHANVQASFRPAGSAVWQPPADVSPTTFGSYASGLDLALDAAGNAVAVWGGGPIQAAIRPAASTAWQPSVDVAAPPDLVYSADVAMDERGNALAVWATGAVVAAELAGAGPVFARVDVPVGATARVPVTVSADVVPWASPLAGVPHWSFGDGASADGATVSHVYATPGSYTVSVTQADSAGGTSSATRTIAVAAPTLANTARPSIRGRPHVGATLTCRPGSWAGTAPIRYAYAWLRDGRRVSTGPRRRLVLRDAGTLVACRVRATNPAGSIEARSRPLRIRR